MFFLLLVSWNTFQSCFLKQFFITSQFKNKKMADFGDYKNIPRSPFHYSLQIDEFDRGFSNRKPFGG